MIVVDGTLSEKNIYLNVVPESSFKNITSVNLITDIVTGESAERYLLREFRYSYDGETYSQWAERTPLFINNIQSSLEVYIELRFSIQGTATEGDITVEEVNFDITYPVIEVVEPTKCETNCSAMVSDCDGTYDIYQMEKFNCRQEALNIAVHKMYSHTVKYFRAVPDKATSDVIFKEYSLYEHEAPVDLNIVIPNNDVPSNDHEFQALGLDFLDMPFEIHLLKDEWIRKFGANTFPRRKDVIYLEIRDKMFSVNSIMSAGRASSIRGYYYRLNLVKYNDDLSILKDQETEDLLDDLVVSFDDVHGQDKEEILSDTTKEEQYDEIIVGNELDIFSYYNQAIFNETISLKNNWSSIADSSYNMKFINNSLSAVRYSPSLSELKDKTFSFWFKMTGDDVNTNIFTISKSILSISGSNTNFSFDLNDNLWYGMILMFSETFKQVTLKIYSINEHSLYSNTENESMGLNLVLDQNKEFNDTIAENYFELLGGQYTLTNIRVFGRLLLNSECDVVLTQNILNGISNSIIVDNCRKPVNLMK